MCLWISISIIFIMIVHASISATGVKLINLWKKRAQSLENFRMWQRDYDTHMHPLMVVNRDHDHFLYSSHIFLKKYGIVDNGDQSSKKKPKKTQRVQRKIIPRTPARPKKIYKSYGIKKDACKQGFLYWPLDKKTFWISSFFGPRKKPNRTWGFHYGIDMAAARGTKVHAAASGRITSARYQKGYGNTIIIKHDQSFSSLYAHLDTLLVCEGECVHRGRVIGTVGDTGHTIKSGKEASHLHFEVYERGRQVNPLLFLP